MASPKTKVELLRLFRSPLCTARQFSDYIREYTSAANTFRRNKSLSEPFHLSSAFCDGKSQQELVSKLYPQKMTSIMDLKLKPIN